MELFKDIGDPRLLVGAGVIPVLLYKVWQVLRQDGRSRSQDAATDKFYEALQEQLNVMTARCDTFSAERNTALLSQARTEAELSNLKLRLVDAEAKKLTLEVSAGLDHQTIRDLTTTNAGLVARVEVLELARQSAPQPALPHTP